jgi:hypothetical protein
MSPNCAGFLMFRWLADSFLKGGIQSGWADHSNLERHSLVSGPLSARRWRAAAWSLY